MSESGAAASASVSLPSLHGVQLAQLLQGEHSAHLLTSLDQGAMPRRGFTILYLLPPVKTGVVDLTTANQEDAQRAAEELLGEDPRRMSKMSTTFSMTTSVVSLEGVKSLCANIMTLFSVLAVCDPDVLASGGEGRDPPFMYTMAAAYFKCITGLRFRRRYDEVARNSPWVLYSIIHGMEKLSCIVFTGARDAKNARAVTRGAWPEVCDLIKTAQAAMTRHLAELQEFAEGGKTPDTCALYENSPHKRGIDAAKARAADRATLLQFQRMEADLKKSTNRRTANDDNPRQEKTRRIAPTDRVPAAPPLNRSGDILCSLGDRERMPLPRITCSTEKPCVSWLRDGQACKRTRCPYPHTPIDKLSPETQKEWIRFVQRTPCLSFNPKRVRSAAMSLANMRPAAALAELPAPAPAPED